MRASLLLLAVAFAVDVQGRNWLGQPAYYEWPELDLGRWLQDHKVPNPGNLNKEQLRDLVHQNWNKVYDGLTDNQISASFASLKLPTPTPSTRDRLVNALQRSYDQTYTSWDSSDLKEWLEDHGLKPKPKATHEELLDQVKASWDSAGSYVGAAANRAQQVLQDASDYSGWTDSQLRQYLLDNGVISPASNREQLLVQARRLGKDASSTATNAYNSASQTASQTIDAAWYAATDGPAIAYDFTVGKLDDAKDYVFSTFEDNQLKSYLVEHGIIKSDAEKKRDELLGSVSKAYNEGAANVYDAWSDNRIRSWLEQHGVVRTKQAKTRDDLLDLISRNYYGARDTTYHYWNDNTIRTWLESRGLIESNSKTSPQQARDLIAENYYALRDKAYQTYDDNLLRSTLEKYGVINTPAGAKRDELLKSLQDTAYTANDRIWDTWSDAKMRMELVREKVVDSAQASSLQRPDLEKLFDSNYAKFQSNWKQSDMRDWLIKNNFLKSDTQATADDITSSFKQNFNSAASKTNAYLGWTDARIRAWLREHNIPVPLGNNRNDLIQAMRENYVSTQSGLNGFLASIQELLEGGKHVAQENIDAALSMLGGAVGTGIGYGEEAGLRAKYGAVKGTADAKSIASQVSASASSLSVAATKSASSLSSSASSAASVFSASVQSAATSYSKSASSAASSLSSVAVQSASSVSSSASSYAAKQSDPAVSKSATSAASVASASASSYASSLSSSASSLASYYSSSASVAAASASKSAQSVATSLLSSASSAASLASQSASSISASASSAASAAAKSAKSEL